MTITDRPGIARAYHSVCAAALEDGEELAFDFQPHDVEAVHTHFTGQGDGVYFRLKAGGVVNSYGENCDPNPALYDTVAN